MKNSLYGSTLSKVYDTLNDGIDYGLWADFIENAITKFSDIKVNRICELACGTGNMALELSKRNYIMTASDISVDMLTVADAKAKALGLDIRFICQDMRKTELFSKADCILCVLDSINYLTKLQDIDETFIKVSANLNDGGLFIFDVNSKFKFENIYADNSYILESKDIFCAWQNFYNSKSRICDFYLSIFTQNHDGSYYRCNENQREKMYTVKQLSNKLISCGFLLCSVFGSYDFEKADESRDERLYFVAKKVSC